MAKEKWTVLIVDDDLTMVRTLEKLLVNNNCNIISASDGDSAIEKAKTHTPDAILLDLMLPDVNGQEVARRLKGEPETKDIPVVFISVTVGVENDKGNEELEIDGQSYRIFAKPLHSAKLWSVIRKEINRSKNN